MSLLELVENGRPEQLNRSGDLPWVGTTLGEPVGYPNGTRTAWPGSEMLVDVIQRQDRRQFAVMAWLGRITMHPIMVYRFCLRSILWSVQNGQGIRRWYVGGFHGIADIQALY